MRRRMAVVSESFSERTMEEKKEKIKERRTNPKTVQETGCEPRQRRTNPKTRTVRETVCKPRQRVCNSCGYENLLFRVECKAVFDGEASRMVGVR